jgi:hypothetical protein
MAFTIKRFDTSPTIGMNLQDAAANPVSIVNALDVRFHMRLRGEQTLKIDARASVIDAETGTVKYDWLTQDTDTAGRYEAEIEVTYTDGSIETFPNGGYLSINIIDDIT